MSEDHLYQQVDHFVSTQRTGKNAEMGISDLMSQESYKSQGGELTVTLKRWEDLDVTAFCQRLADRFPGAHMMAENIPNDLPRFTITIPPSRSSHHKKSKHHRKEEGEEEQPPSSMIFMVLLMIHVVSWMWLYTQGVFAH